MNLKTFLFWAGVAAVGFVVAYFVIEYLKKSALELISKPRREIGFHAVEANAAAVS
jgi:uncharacterized membrane protein YjfL (UPF0719 family)